MGKDEIVIERPARTSGMPDTMLALGRFRVQKDYDKDQVHVHSGKDYFRFDGIDKFLDLWDLFWKNAPAFAMKKKMATVVFRGKTDDPGSNRKPCDLVFHYHVKAGGWSMYLEPVGDMEGYEMNNDLMIKMNYHLKYGEK